MGVGVRDVDWGTNCCFWVVGMCWRTVDWWNPPAGVCTWIEVVGAGGLAVVCIAFVMDGTVDVVVSNGLAISVINQQSIGI